MNVKTKMMGWAILFVVSILSVIIDIVTFQTSVATDTGKAFDTGQVIGILIWVAVAILSGFMWKRAKGN